MSDWCDYLCDFPDDGGVALDILLDAMPPGSGNGLTHTPLPYYRARLSSPGAAIALTITVPGVIQIEGLAEGSEVLVPREARATCERQIDALNHGPTRWTRLERIEARRDVWGRFELIWREYAATG